MDYMHLGEKSRKTGLQIGQEIKKDEYSMENIDDYFDEDDDNDDNDDREGQNENSRKNNINNNGIGSMFSMDRRKKQRYSKLFNRSSHNTPNKRSPSILSPSQINSINNTSALEIPINFSPVGISSIGNIGSTPARSDDLKKYHTNYDTMDSLQETYDELDGQIQDTRHRNKNEYEKNRLPDLIEESEEDSTIESSLLNTSEDALLEDEIYHKNQRNYNERDTYENSDDIYLSDSYQEYIPGDRENGKQKSNTLPNGALRRSKRVRIPTLDYWRNEKIVYKRNSHKVGLDISKVITYDKDDNSDRGEMKQKIKSKIKQSLDKTKTNEVANKKKPRSRALDLEYNDPNRDIRKKISKGQVKTADWLKDGYLDSEVRTHKGKKNAVIAYSSSYTGQMKIQENDEEHYKLNVLFDENKDHFASGLLTIPVKGKRRTSSSGNVSLIFNITQGIVEVTLEDSIFTCLQGSTIQVPPNNNYSFINKGNDDVIMFFVQITELSQKSEKVETEEYSDIYDVSD